MPESSQKHACSSLSRHQLTDLTSDLAPVCVHIFLLIPVSRSLPLFHATFHNTSLSTFGIKPSIPVGLGIFLSTLHFLTICFCRRKRRSHRRKEFVLVAFLSTQLCKAKRFHYYLCFESRGILLQLGKTLQSVSRNCMACK